MQDDVVIKSYKDGIRLLLNPETDFPQLLIKIGEKFAQSKNFFGSSSVVFALEGRTLSDDEEMAILQTVSENCDLKILCLVNHDDEKNRDFIKARQQMEKKMRNTEKSLIYRGSLINSQVLEFEESIVVFGDVNPGCRIVSSGSIVIMGGLYGEAFAGQGGDGSSQRYNSFVAALEMNPEKLVIEEKEYVPREKGKWGIRMKLAPKIAMCKGNEIVFENMSRQAMEKLNN